MTVTSNSREQEARLAAKQFFEFIKEFTAIRSKAQTQYQKAGQVMDLDPIRQKSLPGVFVSLTGVDLILAVERPDLPVCPSPNELLRDWVIDGWQDPKSEAKYRAFQFADYTDEELEALQDRIGADGEMPKKKIYFEDEQTRTQAWQSWMEIRKSWQEEYARCSESHRLYTRLYDWRSILEREGYQKGCFLCNGFVRSSDGAVEYPLLLQRALLDLDLSNVKPVMRVHLSGDGVTQIASEVLRRASDDFALEAVPALRRTVEETGIDLLDQKRIGELISGLAASLSSACAWQDSYNPGGYNEATHFLFYPRPILFLTELPNGVKEAVDKIQEQIDAGATLPSPMRHLLCGYETDETSDGDPQSEDDSPEACIARVGGESRDVLLALPANRDQLDIARKVARADAVLVQGPPGTGKTHTIANLLGSMLADGQRVLVTSATDKALSVLRDKLPKEIQPLCVTLLDTQSSSAAQDLRRAVDGICSTIQRPDFGVASLRRREQFLSENRKSVMKQLADVRHKLFAVRNDESGKVSFQGQARSLSEWARWLHEREEACSSVLPDAVSEEKLGLERSELEALYRTNDELSAQDEAELDLWLPNPESLPSVRDVADWIEDQKDFSAAVEQSPVQGTADRHGMTFLTKGGQMRVSHEGIQRFALNGEAFKSNCQDWERLAQIDGMTSLEYGQTPWRDFALQTAGFVRGAVERRKASDRPDVVVPSDDNLQELQDAAAWFIANAPDGEIPLKHRLFHRAEAARLRAIKERVTVAGKIPADRRAFEAILDHIRWQHTCSCMAHAWDERIGASGGPKFASLGERPEVEMQKFITRLEAALSWWATAGKPVVDMVKAIGIDSETFFGIDELSPNECWRDAVWKKTQSVLLPIASHLSLLKREQELNDRKQALMSSLTPPDGLMASKVAQVLVANVLKDEKQYADALAELVRLRLLLTVKARRDKLLERLALHAPAWAQAIRLRKDGWTQSRVPDEVWAALRWRSVADLVSSFYDVDYDELQRDAVRLSANFRSVSAELAATRAWMHLAERLEAQRNLLQSLTGWMGLVTKIGKGTGKHAARLQSEARRQAKQCQSAVPVWVMTTQRALTTLDPKERFDVIIVDEASQSDLTSLAVLYMGKRIVVVGDDQQVSPMGIGTKSEDVAKLQSMYLTSANVKNAGLYDEKASLYDIVKTISVPVMLREHFRCASDIIEFSNNLSYDGKIVPLRDMSNVPIRPHLISYRVNGRRDERDMNRAEADAIVALIKSCIEQPEYAGKTFGVISMFSGKNQGQVALIESLLKKAIPTKEFEARRISVGISANFQGDERDVIFLSLVQSRTDSEKMLRREGDGIGNSTKKRYNVAVSRARDQLWVVHSFDPVADVAADDIRRRLLNHVLHPKRVNDEFEALSKRFESPFEKDVARDLITLGYQIEPQYSVGSYRLDFVVRDGDRAVALECDGDRYHNTAEAIVKDMERQAILERSGWTFVRVRGGEYYRHPKEAMERVCRELAEHGVRPNFGKASPEAASTELLDRVRARAAELLREEVSDVTDADIGVESFGDATTAQIEQASAKTDAEAPSVEGSPVSESPNSTAPETPKSANGHVQDSPLVPKDTQGTSRHEKDVSPVGAQVPSSSGKFSEPMPTSRTKRGATTGTDEVPPATADVQGVASGIADAMDFGEQTTELSTVKDFHFAELTPEQQQRILKEDAYMFSLFRKNGWDVYDNRYAPSGALWVVAGKEAFEPAKRELYDKFGLFFMYTAKPGRTRGGQPGWWLCNRTVNRAKAKH